MPPADHVISLCRAGWLQLCSLPRSSTATWWGWVCPSALVTLRSRSRVRRICCGCGWEPRQQTEGTSCVNDSSDYRHRGPRRENVTVSGQTSQFSSLPLILPVIDDVRQHLATLPITCILSNSCVNKVMLGFNERKLKTTHQTIHLAVTHDQKWREG